MRSYLWVVPVLAAVALFFSARAMLEALPEAHIDLEVYRFGVQAWWEGRDMYGELPAVVGGTHLPFIYPPFAVLILSPLAILPWDAAVVTLFVVNFLCLAATLYVVARRVWPAGGRGGAIVLGSAGLPIACLLEPVSQTFEFGQISLILMALIAVDCLAGRTWWPRGLGVGLAAAIKLFPAAFVLFFLARRDYRSALTAAITWFVATAIGFVTGASDSIRYWFGGFAGASGVSGTAFRTNQAIDAVLTRTGMPEGLSKVLWILLVAALLVVVAIAIRRGEPAAALLANAGFTLLASPTSWSHYWVWVVPTMLVTAVQAVRRWREGSRAAWGWLVATLGAAVLFYLAPFRELPQTTFPEVQLDWTPEQQLLGASYVLGGLVLLLAYAIPKLRTKPEPGPLPELGPPKLDAASQ
ncbi:glycosyltransferase 87 family protein [Amycolatopsis anabasis]|uniref:glycosyltransferase 87 family protein n=1 Tax=Amycolatopsis anabasis TaxID=1840409 RepID=UPI00131E79A2|nr:glycosyltransferase 87 family protein [Amycolatopsis anabasis]